MPRAALYRTHDPAGQARYQELKQLARSQRRILAGTPGTLKQRTQSAKQYWVREHIRVDGKKADEYIGPVSTVDQDVVDRVRSEIDLAKALAAGSGKLRLFGYQRIDRKPAAVLEVIFNRGLFKAGLTLVGSQAYGALLNELGINAPGYKTQDIDLARSQPLAIALPDGVTLPGAETLAVDLLKRSKKTGPLLDFLIEDPLWSVALSPNQVIPVRIPSPERFLLHKLFSSQSRTAGDRDKIRKDLQQAAVLAAALEEETPGSLSDAYRRMPAAGKAATRRGSLAASKLLDTNPEAQSVLKKIAAR